jgi:hypothetical protein
MGFLSLPKSRTGLESHPTKGAAALHQPDAQAKDSAACRTMAVLPLLISADRRLRDNRRHSSAVLSFAGASGWCKEHSWPAFHRRAKGKIICCLVNKRDISRILRSRDAASWKTRRGGRRAVWQSGCASRPVPGAGELGGGLLKDWAVSVRVWGLNDAGAGPKRE